ncbi:hypothetical protein DDZ13_00145 [Coraliomargarita sinensis]|uniref:Uncharacterized protein n=1 Tax=Coraliomargarita sinensis TaxID=2174842 RepID=A0A317ZIH3_9BACT|nr:hypothetical protein [Coraliomargarita sinensis]PXA05310.1 hypothetical protein DDZ13_00145 [Coraliomargarita sinensis]
MKYSLFFTMAVVASLLLPRSVDARIGERRESFERRLFSNGGIIYRDKEERKTRRSSGPYTQYLQYLGNSAEVRVYFKSDDGRQPTQSDLDKGTLGSGWEVHVLFVGGKSVLETYKRVGSMSEYEMNALLAVLGGGAYWEEAEPPVEDELEKDEPPPSAFGFDYVRSDGEVRAKKSGGGLMVFQKQLDEFLAKQHEGNLIQSAPQSVQGF